MKNERLEEILKDYFNTKMELPDKRPDCPSAEMLAQYAFGALGGDENCNLGSHVKSCGFCRELIEDAFMYSTYTKEIKLGDVPAKIKKKAKLLDPAYKGKEHKIISFFKKKIWLVLSLSSFMASFFAPRYFLQFLALAVILGLKWILDKETTRTLIMVYNAWKKHDRTGEKNLEEIFKDRF